MKRFPEAVCGLAIFLILAGSVEAARRSATQEGYARQLWTFLHKGKGDYRNWRPVDDPRPWSIGPSLPGTSQTFANEAAHVDPTNPPAVFVTESLGNDERRNVIGVTVRYKVGRDSDTGTSGWYWAHFLADGTLVQSSSDVAPFDRPGYVTHTVEGRLWVVELTDPSIKEILAGHEPTTHVIRPGAGPAGLDLKGTSPTALDGYLAVRPGFAIRHEGGRLWVFRAGSDELADHDRGELPTDPVMRPGIGPGGITLNSPNTKTLEAYLGASIPAEAALPESSSERTTPK